MTTPNLGMTLPTVGADLDTWGTELNTALSVIDDQLVGVLYGLTLSAAGGTGTFGIAAGIANGMALGSAYTKGTGTWSVGPGGGGLDTGAVANATWYHVWLIQRLDTGVVDVLFSLNATSPTMPANYTRKRRIGSMLTDGSAHWVKFYQDGDDFLWDVPVADVTASAPGTAAVLRTLSVPTGVMVKANIAAGLNSEAALSLYLSSPNVSDTATNFVAGVADIAYSNTIANPLLVPCAPVLTDTSARIRSRLSVSTASTTLYIYTKGWNDRRGRF